MFLYYFGILSLALISIRFTDSRIPPSELIKHKFFMYNRSPKSVYIYKVRHTIVQDAWEKFSDIYRGIELAPNDSSLNFQFHIRHSDSIEEWQDWWVMLFYYDQKNYTATKPFYCRCYEQDAKAPVELIIDFYNYELHVKPPVSKNCSTKIHYVPEVKYDYDIYPHFMWLTTGGLWW